MAQTYKMMLGTSGKQWEILTVKDDGTMMLYFHGTNQSVTQQVTVITEGEWKGWLRSEKGSMFPGLESGRWQLMDDVRCMMEDVRGKMEDVVETTEPAVGSEAERERTTEGLSPMCAEPAVPVESALRGQAPCNPPSATHTGDSPREPSPRRQRKQRKPRTNNRETITNNRETSSISPQPSDINRQSSSTLKAVGMVAAATVALLVIYETGLLIPLGLIGLATGGILK